MVPRPRAPRERFIIHDSACLSYSRISSSSSQFDHHGTLSALPSNADDCRAAAVGQGGRSAGLASRGSDLARKSPGRGFTVMVAMANALGGIDRANMRVGRRMLQCSTAGVMPLGVVLSGTERGVEHAVGQR